MPIKPENRGLYPKDWPAISQEVRRRASWCCQHPGCTAQQYQVGVWRRVAGGAHAWEVIEPKAASYSAARQRAAEITFARFGDGPADEKLIVIVLTVAHLDHDPANCAPENLAAMCQRHHLAYDQQHHAETAYMSRKAGLNNLELPL